jgi:hypothetical protein
VVTKRLLRLRRYAEKPGISTPPLDRTNLHDGSIRRAKCTAWQKAVAFGVPNRNGKSARVSCLFDRGGRLARVYPEVDPAVDANQVLDDVATLE